jgi:multimeric flavodoxin WrbA
VAGYRLSPVWRIWICRSDFEYRLNGIFEGMTILGNMRIKSGQGGSFMHIICFNGSPRNNGTTAILLNKALEGTASQGAKTELIQLNQINMKGCQSCYSCKKIGSKNFGKCALVDGMTPLYEKIENADAIFMGSPIYFGTVTAAAKMFIERLFPYLSYRKPGSSIFPKKIHVGLIFTMGVEEQIMEKEYWPNIQFYKKVFSDLLGPAEAIISTDTLHVKNYAEIAADWMETQAERKLEHQRTVFPLDCEKAFKMGARFAAPEKV